MTLKSNEQTEAQDEEEYQPPEQATVAKNEASVKTRTGKGNIKIAEEENTAQSKKPSSSAKSDDSDKPIAQDGDSTAVKDEDEDEDKRKAESKDNTSPSQKPKASPKKRKAASSTTPTPNKTRRTRASNTNNPNPINPHSLIHYLLSSTCATLVRSPDEQSHHTSHPSHLTYTTNPPLTPFAELLSALLLSRPISHNLGHRSIRTLLNPPWNYTTPSAVLKPTHTLDISEVRDGEAARLAGGDAARTVYKALDDARTQHKAKTASQLVGLAEVCAGEFCDGDDDAELSRLRQMVQDADDGQAGKVFEDAVKNKVKGVGPTGVEIARRRLQGIEGWAGVGPFIDSRTKGVLERMGMSGDAEQVWELVAGCVDDGAEVGEEEGKLKGEMAKWKAFVTVLERAVEADLAGKIDEVLEQAVGSAEK